MKLRRTLAVIAAAITAVSLVACSGGSPAADTPGGSSGPSGGPLTIGYGFEPNSFDPAQAQEGHFIAFYQGVYDTLLLREPNGDIAPMLATDWEYNDDKTELTLKLRDDVTFTDDSKFDAEVVKANIEHFQTAGGPQGATLNAVESVDVVDATTVKLNLSEPDPALLIYLSNAGGMMGSAAALGSDDMTTTPVGSGPYTLDKSGTTIGSQYTYVKKDDYWNPELQHYDTITFKIITDTTARFNALASGQIDVTLLDAKTATGAEDAGMTAHVQQLDWLGLLINDRGGEIVPALADVRVRQAINLAIDSEAILSGIAQGRGEPTGQVFGPTADAFDASLTDTYPYDPERAKELLADAGYADGFTFQLPTAAAFDPAIFAVLKDQFAAVGITVDYVDVPLQDFITEAISGKYPVVFMSLFRPSTWVTVQQLIAPEALWNSKRTEDPKVSALFEDIQFASDETTAAAKGKELNKYVTDEAWFAPIYAPDMLYYGNDKVAVELQAEQASPSIYNYSPAK